MTFRFIEDHREVFPVRAMCSVLTISASGYYVRRTSRFDAWRSRPESARAGANRALVEDIRRVHANRRRRYGSPRVHASLRARGNPKGTDLSAHSADDLAAVGAALNTRPRKTLGWKTPAEAFDQVLRSVQAGVATTG